MSRASDLERQMLDLINAERTSRDLNPVTLELRLNDSSEMHSQWMLEEDRFSHTGENGSSAGDRMRDADFKFEGSWSWGENIAYQSERGEPGFADDVIDLHNSLMNSPGHRANILDPDYEAIGLGIEIGEFNGFEVIMVTQNFADTAAELLLDEADAPAPLPEPEPEAPAPEQPVEEVPSVEPDPDVPVAEGPDPDPEPEPDTPDQEPAPNEPVAEDPEPEPDMPVAEPPEPEPDVPVAEAPEPEAPIDPASEDPVVEAPGTPGPQAHAQTQFQFFIAGFFGGFVEDNFFFDTDEFDVVQDGSELTFTLDLGGFLDALRDGFPALPAEDTTVVSEAESTDTIAVGSEFFETWDCFA